jgi:hypothetical protein
MFIHFWGGLCACSHFFLSPWPLCAGETEYICTHADVGGVDHLGMLLLQRTDSICARVLACAGSRFRWTSFLSQFYYLSVPDIKQRGFIEVSSAHRQSVLLRVRADVAQHQCFWRPLKSPPPTTLHALAVALEPFRHRVALRPIAQSVAQRVGHNGFNMRASLAASVWPLLYPPQWTPTQHERIEAEGWRSRPTSAQPRLPTRAMRDALVGLADAQSFARSDGSAHSAAAVASSPSSSSSSSHPAAPSTARKRRRVGAASAATDASSTSSDDDDSADLVASYVQKKKAAPGAEPTTAEPTPR